ncbi:hypothetical protein Bealeia1_01677 [Candidatus Bealeia paramacronuclearis]|uniref:Type VI secretion system lipoprotein TssJ n=2 Tax=Candidatus Bealeia paramacronuclearis TaxID=1921001 RepID=A0ABZ2C7J9_9PROT|nr:hypothetical protein [Candidatus Bealeia paramacronuclearis]
MALFMLQGCSSENKPTLNVSSASIFSEPDANKNSAIAVDVVLVYNQDLLGAIAKLPAQKYFEASNQLRLDNPSLLDVWRWELVPGQVVKDFELESDKGKAFGGLIFANYLTPGDHRVKIPPSGEIKILLKKDDLISMAEGSFDGLNVGKTASDDVPVTPPKTPKKKVPCDTDSGSDEASGGFVILQSPSVSVDPHEDNPGKELDH